MISPDVLTKFMDSNKAVLGRQLDGLTHEDSILQVPFRGNCLNWVIGHIVASRDGIMRTLDLEGSLTEEQRNLYKGGSEPITPDSDALDLHWLWEAYQEQDKHIRATLEAKTMDDFEQVMDDSDQTVGDRLRFLLWHETYHVGQTEYLRQLAGTDDKVI